MTRADGGLGLFIVRQVAELHGGSVTAHSDGPGHGSMFVIHLPVNLGAPPPTRPDAVLERQA
jgi:signal transduction histidine kinase